MNKRQIFRSTMLILLLLNAGLAIYDGRLSALHWLSGMVAGGLLAEILKG
jgi:hypothetical protein